MSPSVLRAPRLDTPTSIPSIHNRSNYLGGSDAAAVVGKSIFKTTLKLWAEKTGRIPIPNLDDEFRIRWGKRCEDDVCDEWSFQTGKKLHRVRQTLIHPQHEFIVAHIDRRVVGEIAGFEAKTSSEWKYKDWQGDDIPWDYIFQCYHYMAVTGWPKWYIGCALGNRELAKKEISADPKIQHELICREVQFWNEYVLPKKEPPGVSYKDKDVLNDLFPQAIEGKVANLGDTLDRLAEAKEAAEADKRQSERLIAQLENEIKLLMGDADLGLGINFEARWKNSKRSCFNVTKFKADQPNIHAAYYETKPTRLFSCDKIEKEQ